MGKSWISESSTSRLKLYAVRVFVLWPLITVIFAAVELRRTPYYSPPWPMALTGGAAGTFFLLPDILLAGVLTTALGTSLFSVLGKKGLLRRSKPSACEPWLLFLALIFSTALFYPGIMGFSAPAIIGILPFWAALCVLVVAILGLSTVVARPGAQFKIAAIVVGCAAVLPVATSLRGKWPSSGGSRPPLVLLGLDSLSQSDDLTILKSLSIEKKGVWYSNPVSPGLLTNAVWTSLLTESFVHEHGVFHTFQSLPEARTKARLLDQARSLGYWTVSVFPDQLTCFVGSTFGFDEDRSGAVGWRQLAISTASNSSILLPLLRPVLPRLPLSVAPTNQAGTYTYDLDRELREIFQTDHVSKKVFVAAHTTYLHSPVYPRTQDMSWSEIKRVLRATGVFLRDRTFDWQDVDLPIDPIMMRKWKLRRLQESIVKTLDSTQFLERGGQLALMSDHGDRAGMTMSNFNDERYHRVLLVTFNLPSKDPEAQISLLDVTSLVEINKQTEPFPPIVEYTNATSEHAQILGQRVELRFNGTVHLDEPTLKEILRMLKVHKP